MPKIPIPKEVFLWKDRKRFLGIPITFTRYQATEERVIVRKGFFRTEVDEVLIYRIIDIRLVRTLRQKIFGVGSVFLISTDKTSPTLELKNIAKSDKVRRFFGMQVEKQRELRRITGREYIGGSMGDAGEIDY